MFQLLKNGNSNQESVRRAEALGIYDLQNAVLGNLDDEVLYPSKTMYPHLILVDDDPMFTKVVERVAYWNDTPLSVCHSIDELGSIENWSFDAAIVDYDLGSVTGVDLSKYLEHFMGSFPVLYISQTDRKLQIVRECPGEKVLFANKEIGPKGILETAIAMHRVWPF